MKGMAQQERDQRSEGILVEFNQYAAHVIASQLLLGGVFGQKPVQQFLEHLFGPLTAHPLLADDSNEILTVFLISFPDAVAADEDEVIVLAEFNYFDFGVAGDGLAVVLQLCVFLVVEIAKTS